MCRRDLRHKDRRGDRCRKTLKFFKNYIEHIVVQVCLEQLHNDRVGNAYFSKPGPRTITGLEILAKIIHPEDYVDIELPYNSSTRVTIN